MQQNPQQHLVPPSLPLAHNQKQYRLTPGQTLSASTSPTNNILPHLHQQQQQQFPKSHSIDNLPREMFQQKPVSYSNNNSNVWNKQKQLSSPQTTTELQNPQQQNSQIDPSDMSLNLHKKLQRQLSLLNPYDDPRLYPMQQRFQNPLMPPTQKNPDLFLSSSPAHKSLTTSHSLTSGGTSNQTHSIYEHQVSVYII